MMVCNDKCRISKQQGAATLAITLVLLLVLVIVTFFTVSVVIKHQRYSSSLLQTKQAFNAAQSGLDYGFSYLNKNMSTVTDNMIVANTLSDGSSYSAQYLFQGGNNDLVKIKSTGTSADGSATRVVEILANKVTLLINMPNLPITSAGRVRLQGGGVITNLSSNSTIISGDSVSITGSAQTVLVSGVSSYKNNIETDIIQNDSSLDGMASLVFQVTYLGQEITFFKEYATEQYTQDGNYDALLNGQTGKLIWIEPSSGGAVSLSGNTIVGTAESPVTLVINTELSVSGNATVHGNVIVSKDFDVSGNADVDGLVFVGGDARVSGSATVDGGLLVAGEIRVTGTGNVTYDTGILTETMSYELGYGKVEGSWNDLNPN